MYRKTLSYDKIITTGSLCIYTCILSLNRVNTKSLINCQRCYGTFNTMSA